MPQFNEDTPRNEVVVKGLKMTIPHAFSAESLAAMSDEDRGKAAKFINERLESILINAYGGDLRRALDNLDNKRKDAHKAGTYTGALWTREGGKDDGKELKHPVPAGADVGDLDWDHQARMDTKYLAYKVGESNAREAVPKDPTESIAWDIAEREVKNRIAQKGMKVKPLIDARNEEHGSEFKRLVHERLNHPAHKDRIYALAKAQIESSNGEEEDDMVIPDELQERYAADKTDAEKEAA